MGGMVELEKGGEVRINGWTWFTKHDSFFDEEVDEGKCR